jgi:hypothetical protein
MKQMVAALVLLALVGTAARVRAEDGLAGVMHDALYGGMIGALVGAAVLPFTEHPGDHLDYIAIGAGAGVIAGTLYGLVQANRSFAALEDGRLTVGLPLPELRPVLAGSRLGIATDVTLFAWRF